MNKALARAANMRGALQLRNDPRSLEGSHSADMACGLGGNGHEFGWHWDRRHHSRRSGNARRSNAPRRMPPSVNMNIKHDNAKALIDFPDEDYGLLWRA
ncbi:MAG: hypothetical protein WAM72_27675 [Xanthobacteraceae bacterium]